MSRSITRLSETRLESGSRRQLQVEAHLLAVRFRRRRLVKATFRSALMSSADSLVVIRTGVEELLVTGIGEGGYPVTSPLVSHHDKTVAQRQSGRLQVGRPLVQIYCITELSLHALINWLCHERPNGCNKCYTYAHENRYIYPELKDYLGRWLGAPNCMKRYVEIRDLS